MSQTNKGQEAKKPVNGTKLAAIILTVILAVCAIAGIIWALSRSNNGEATEPTTEPTTATTEPTNISTQPTEDVLTEEELAQHPVLAVENYTGEEGDLSAMDEVIATIDGNTITNSQFAIWYWQTYYDMMNQMGGYASYYGLDTTKPLYEQSCPMAPVPMTWEQYFVEYTLSNWHSYLTLYLEAKANNMTLSEENQTALDNMEAEMTANAKTYGFEDATAMLEADYGAGVTMEDYKYFTEVLMLGNQYYTERMEALAPTAEEVDAYYQENLANYTMYGVLQDGSPASISVRHILIQPENILDSEETDSTEPTDATEETLSDDELMELCRQKAQDILDQWKAGEATEESFAALATAYTEDPGSATTGGLYENVVPGQMVTEFNDWCFNAERKPGDTELVQTSYGIHIMYFVSADETEYWYSCASADLSAERVNEMLTEAMENYEMNVEYTKIRLCPLPAALY